MRDRLEHGDEKESEEETKEARKEAALASLSCLRPNFKRPGVTQEQLSKLRELHKRRLQIKAKSKSHKKEKGGVDKSGGKNLANRMSEDGNLSAKIEESSSFNSKNNSNDGGSSTQLDNKLVHETPKKPQKLYWGLDTKERWERKANM